MKTPVLIVLFGCSTVFAQTNIISFTNASGVFITNATAIKIAENKLLYRTPSGGGIVRLDSLPADIQAKFNYNPTLAAAQDDIDKTKKEIDRQNQIAAAQQAARQQQWNAAYKEALKREVNVSGNIIQKIDAGLLVSWPGDTVDPPEPSVTILMVDHPNYQGLAAQDQVFINAFPLGLYTYKTVNKSENTIHVWTCNTNVAVQYYLTH